MTIRAWLGMVPHLAAADRSDIEDFVNLGKQVSLFDLLVFNFSHWQSAAGGLWGCGPG
jgi:hypothetical protein